MNISKKNDDAFSIECNWEELAVLCNALNNIPQAVADSEYSSLIGISKDDTRKIMAMMVKVLRDPAE
jgi:hypothetical protein